MKADELRGINRGLTDYGDPEFSIYIRKAFAKAMGYADHELERPIVGIIDTSSGFNSCHQNFPDLIEAVKGVFCRRVGFRLHSQQFRLEKCLPLQQV